MGGLKMYYYFEALVKFIASHNEKICFLFSNQEKRSKRKQNYNKNRQRNQFSGHLMTLCIIFSWQICSFFYFKDWNLEELKNIDSKKQSCPKKNRKNYLRRVNSLEKTFLLNSEMNQVLEFISLKVFSVFLLLNYFSIYLSF